MPSNSVKTESGEDGTEKEAMIAFLLMPIMVFVLSACKDTGNVQNSNVQENEEQTTDV